MAIIIMGGFTTMVVAICYTVYKIVQMVMADETAKQAEKRTPR